ncbi:molecular chaperone [Aquitalea sp. LB_tupeE]|uniref:fimbrial biogenesis chaperone n=1 Tax=Aquitalea sp. LB_tupeE TaxID=2748078 RepID=UPI0015BFEDA8|nr:fimbria/pilus periplasmic chaperone [Aquitalea sp. LB_tupeE]NWK76797.1 fimbria/pilus periplasmic chaperone [Aquitalea sp. LB_tupeE]
MDKSKSTLVMIVATLLANTPAMADVYINGTRIIYPAEKREITFTVGNSAAQKTLIQTWIDEGNPGDTPDNSKAPFLLSPPLAAIGALKSQNIRVNYTGEKELPNDKESLFWVNVLEAPKNTQDPNELRISLRTRIKLFYRPQNMEIKPEHAPEKIEWKLEKKENKWMLTANNKSPYFITLSEIKVKTDSFSGMAKISAQNSMFPPQGTLIFSLNPEKTIKDSGISFSTINDYGGTSTYTSDAITISTH